MKRAAIILLLASSAYADDHDDAAKLFEVGRNQKEQGNRDAACKTFEASYALEAAAGTALNLAECKEATDWQAAVELYDGAAKTFEASGRAESAKFARDRAEVLRSAHAPEIEERIVDTKPASPRSSNKIALGIGIGGLVLGVAGGVLIGFAYKDIRVFDNTDLTGEMLSKSEVTQEDCGKFTLMMSDNQKRFEDACSARDRMRWLVPATFISATAGAIALGYWYWTRPKRTKSVAIIPAATGTTVTATFEW